MTPGEIRALKAGDLLVDPRHALPCFWFVHAGLASGPGLRITSQDGLVLYGRDMTQTLQHLTLVRRNPAPPPAGTRPAPRPGARTGR